MELYKTVRKDMGLMDGLQWRGNSKVAKSIRFVTKEYFNHTSAIIRFQEYDRVFSIEADFKDGLDLYPFSKIMERYSGEIWWYPLKYEYKPLAIEASIWLLDRVGITNYDIIGCLSHAPLIRFILGRVPSRAAAEDLYCSESYFQAWKDGPKLKHLQDIKYSPVPGKPMEDLGLWNDPIRLII